MSSIESSPSTVNSTPGTAASTLMRHFPAEAREAYRRFASNRSPADADIVVLAAVLDHTPDKKLRAGGPPADHLQLIGDLGFDSVAITELVFFLEDLFQVRIGNDEIVRVHTVGDLRAFVQQKTAANPPVPPA